MFFALGPIENLETLVSLVTPFAGDQPRQTPDEIRSAYLRFLRDRQPEVPFVGEDHLGIVDDERTTDRLAQLFGLEDTPVGKASGYEEGRDPEESLPGWKRDLVAGGIDDCRQLDPTLGAMLDLVTDSVFATANSLAAGSMTTGKALGVIWIDPLKGWSNFDCVEGLVHEMTHTLLMLDELRYVHYPDYPELKKAENLARSAIRSEARPLNAVVHSYVVAVELLALRARHRPQGFVPRLHAESGELRTKTERARESMLGLDNFDELTTPRLVEVLERVDRLLAETPVEEGPAAAVAGLGEAI